MAVVTSNCAGVVDVPAYEERCHSLVVVSPADIDEVVVA